jgi:hypothetical protein
MSTTPTTTDQAVEEPETAPALQEDVTVERTIVLDLGLDEAEALRAWLLKPAQDGTTSLDDPLVSRTLARLGQAVDSTLATVNVRRELVAAGLGAEHLSDDQVRDLGRRVAEASLPSIRS